MTDLFGESSPRAPFVDIRSTRPTVAEEKARLCLRIGELTRKVPDSVRNGSIQITRKWLSVADAAKKLAASERATVPQLQGAVNNLESTRWHK